MRIKRITPNYQNHQNSGFGGKIIFKQNLEMAETFKNNQTIIDLANSGYDVIGSVSKRCVGDNDYFHTPGTYLYRLLIKIRKENSKFAKIKCALGLTPRTYLSHGYHTDEGNCCIIDSRINPQFILRKLGIDLYSKK